VPPRVARPLAARALLGRDEPGRHVGLAVDGVGVEQVAARLLGVDEDRVVLGGPTVARLRAVVVRPDQLVEEALAAEQLVEQQLAVVRLAVVDVEVQRPLGREQPPHLAQPRLEEAEVVVELVAVGRLAQQPRRVAPAAEADAVPAGVGDGPQRPARLRAAGVERRVEVGHRDARVRLGAQERQVVAEQDPVHVRERIRAAGATNLISCSHGEIG